MTSPAVPLYRYQQGWMLDPARFKIGMFARQTGKTFTTTLEVVDDCFAAALAGRRQRWVTPSADPDQESKEDRHAENPPEPENNAARLPLDAITESAAAEAGPAVARLLVTIREMASQAGDLEELRALLETANGGDLADLEAAMRQAMLLAELTGRAEIQPLPDSE